MKSPAQLAQLLARQWHSADQRESRLLSASAWPLQLNIGKPTATQFAESERMREHLQQWRQVAVGEVVWQPVSYRSASETVDMPLQWWLKTPSEWVAACNDHQVQWEYQQLGQAVASLATDFHRLVIRQRQLVLDKPLVEIEQAGRLVAQLQPGCAAGKPLRALALAGIDSKFFERHRQLLLQLLDVRFDGAASEQGLEAFLGAADEKDHWLLLVPLAADLLPFQQLRVRSRELAQTPLPSQYILLVENERCWHQLPPLADTIAILGAGLNLSWLQAPWLSQKHLAYWGDLDTWGLQMLAQARLYQPTLTPLLMSQKVFEQHRDKAVVEPSPASIPSSGYFSSDEARFFNDLLRCERGRLEQEFLPAPLVAQALADWHSGVVQP